MILRALIVALVAAGGWGWWQHRAATHWRADAAQWRAEAETATAMARQAARAHEVATATLQAELARNRDYDAIRAAITENDHATPVDPAIADALRRLCARDPHCDDAARAAGTAPTVPRPEPEGQHGGSGRPGDRGL